MSAIVDWAGVGVVTLAAAWGVRAEIRDLRQVDREVAARKAARESGSSKKRGEQ